LDIIDDNDDDEYDDYDPLSSVPPVPIRNYSEINVPLFNEIVQYLITSNLYLDESFKCKSPLEKEQILISKYEHHSNTKVNPATVNLNFYATTSYNKPQLKPQDKEQLLIPINPYCRRPDLNVPLTDKASQIKLQQFRKDIEKYSKEFECLEFPSGSRLFIGNLAVNSLKIEDVWRIFSQYGKVVAVNLKQGYGFVQFTNAEDCSEAIKGELNVPLHNKFMQLQVSKTHEKHTEQREDKGIDRDRSPTRKGKKVRVIISIESDTSFNHLLVNSLNEIGVECSVKHVDTNANDVPQDIISESAYAGVCATVVTNKLESVNLFLFQRNSNDGAIKFDEYEGISLDSAINFINRGTIREIGEEIEIEKTEKEKETENGKEKGKEKERERNRDRDSRDRDSRRSSHFNAYHRNHREDGGVRYSPRQQEAQKHLPPQVIPSIPSIPSRIPTIPPMAGTQYYQNTPSPSLNNPVAAQLMNQLSSLDENSLKAMLNLVNQQQNVYIPPAVPTFQGGSVQGLYNQLQNMAPSQPAPAPVAAPAHPPASSSSSSGAPPNGSGEDGEETSRLFETLARLKNNM
ncbi:hypothetical protein JL09_g1399, partial [Pichia kudriavzevii]